MFLLAYGLSNISLLPCLLQLIDRSSVKHFLLFYKAIVPDQATMSAAWSLLEQNSSLSLQNVKFDRTLAVKSNQAGATPIQVLLLQTAPDNLAI